MSLHAERLKHLREQAGLSQRDLSRMCNLAENMVYRYENGLSEPGAKALKTIAEKLNTSADYLVDLSDNPTMRPRDAGLNHEEENMIEIFRREGWPGVVRFGVERLSE